MQVLASKHLYTNENLNKMKYTKIRQVRDLSRGTKRSAGIDFYTPEFSDAYLFDVAALNKKQLEYDEIYIDRHTRTIIIAPNAHILLPSGIKANLMSVGNGTLVDTEGVALICFNRSSIAIHQQLAVAADVIDEDYQGEIHLSLTNNSKRLVKIHEDTKILQCLLMRTFITDLKLVKNDNLFNSETERRKECFGHSNDK